LPGGIPLGSSLVWRHHAFFRHASGVNGQNRNQGQKEKTGISTTVSHKPNVMPDLSGIVVERNTRSGQKNDKIYTYQIPRQATIGFF
jgi:hypothetical protein